MAPFIALNSLPKELPRFEARFDVLELPTEVRLMIFEHALTLSDPLWHTCPHAHDDDWKDFHCNHSDSGCDHELLRPSYTALDRKQIFWLPILTSKQIYDETAKVVVRDNIIAFTRDALTCFHAMEWDAHKDPKTSNSILLSEEIRTMDVHLDFTLMEHLADELAPMSNIQTLTFTATQTWLRTEMLPDFRQVLRKLPELKTCKIKVEKSNLAPCSWCASQECRIWLDGFEALVKAAEQINGGMAKALAKRAAWQAARAAKVVGVGKVVAGAARSLVGR